MLIRTAHDYDIEIRLNKPLSLKKTIQLKSGERKQITYPSSKKYFLLVDGEISQKSDSFQTIEKAYVDKCSEKNDSDDHGRINIVKHKIINNKVLNR